MVLIRHGGYRRAAFAGLVLVLGMGVPTTAAELARAVGGYGSFYGSFRYEHAGNTTLVDLPPAWRRQNVARDVPDLLGGACCASPRPSPSAVRRASPSSRSVFDVYLDGGRLIYVKDRCTPADVMKKRLFLYVTPVNPADLPRHRRRFGSVKSDVWLLDRWPWRPNVLDGRCLFGASLPGFPVARIVTGQQVMGKAAAPGSSGRRKSPSGPAWLPRAFRRKNHCAASRHLDKRLIDKRGLGVSGPDGACKVDVQAFTIRSEGKHPAATPRKTLEQAILVLDEVVWTETG